MNKKGFTLVELLAALAILGIIVTIGGVAISKTINNTKQKDYETLIANIKNAAELYYQECSYGDTTNISCGNRIKLKQLVSYGYIASNTGSGSCINNSATVDCVLKNPKDNKTMDDCSIFIKYEESLKSIVITSSGGPTWCPTNNHYYGRFES